MKSKLEIQPETLEEKVARLEGELKKARRRKFSETISWKQPCNGLGKILKVKVSMEDWRAKEGDLNEVLKAKGWRLYEIKGLLNFYAYFSPESLRNIKKEKGVDVWMNTKDGLKTFTAIKGKKNVTKKKSKVN